MKLFLENFIYKKKIAFSLKKKIGIYYEKPSLNTHTFSENLFDFFFF